MLTPKHRSELLQSGISDHLIDLNFASLDDPREIDKFLNRNTDSRWKHGQLASGWRVAGVDPKDGEYRGIGGQFKPDNPRTNQDGKPIKYESVSGLEAVPLFLDTGDRSYWQKVIADPLIPIVITEGAKKAGCVLSQGIACISISGVSNGQKLGELRDDLKLFCQVGRIMYLAFDMDLYHKPQVAHALDKLGRLLCVDGCVVKVLMWDEVYKGIDDYLVATGDSVVTLIDQAWTFERWRNEFVPKPNPPVTVDKEEKTASVFELLMQIVKSLDFYKQGNEFGDAFVDVVVKGVRQTYRLRSNDFKSWLTRELYSRYQKPANSEALENCLKICEAEAMVMGNIKQVWLKTACHEDKLYIDLCNEKWQAIEVSKHGWRVVESQELPVRFVRSPTQEPLPIPTQKGDLSKLWELLPIAEESKPLVTAWILSCLVATGEKPILVLSAPKGSGKSTIAKFLVNLIDATKSALLPAVGDRRSLAVQSRHRWIFAYDNLTHLSVDQQDAMCCASTGAGYMERKLFTDDEVTAVAYTRPQILTSVDLVPTRSDLLDRCLLVKVKPIPEADRKNIEELDQLFHNYHAEILGAFLDLLWVAVKNRDSIKQPLQRMASFHKLGVAAGIEGFNDAYLASIGNAQQEAIKANPISDAIAELGNFDGTAQELVTKLKAISDDSKVQKLTSRSLGRLLKGSLKSDLEAIGIGIDSYRSAKANHWKILQTDKYGQITPQTPLTPQLLPGKGSSSGIKEYHDSTTLTANSTKTDMPSSVESVELNRLKPSLTPQPETRHSKESGISGDSGVKNDYLSVSTDDNQPDDDWSDIVGNLMLLN